MRRRVDWNMVEAPGYSHTQKGIIRPILVGSAAIFLALAYAYRNQPPPLLPVFLVAAGISVLMSFAFARLMVRDEGDRLAVRFGPLSVFRKTIPYAAMTGVGRDRSTFLAGWGIHYTRKGWLWNIGGFDCVRIEMDARSTLIGTDDPDRLVAFLRSRTGAGNVAGKARP